MTPIVLVDELVQFIKTVVKEFVLNSNVTGIRKEPQVIGGYLGEKKPGQDQNPPDYPYVVVRYLEDEDNGQQDTAIVRIIAGTYSEDAANGWRDALNVLTRIKYALLKQKFFGPFKVEYPVKMELPEEQPFPEWVALMTVNVVIPRTEEEGGYIEDVFAQGQTGS